MKIWKYDCDMKSKSATCCFLVRPNFFKNHYSMDKVPTFYKLNLGNFHEICGAIFCFEEYEFSTYWTA